jgi:hypothetical protein
VHLSPAVQEPAPPALNITRFGVGEEDSFPAPFSFVVGAVSFVVGWLFMHHS